MSHIKLLLIVALTLILTNPAGLLCNEIESSINIPGTVSIIKEFNYQTNITPFSDSSKTNINRFKRMTGAGIALIVIDVVMFIPGLVLAAYGGAQVAMFSAKYPLRRNDVSTNPQFFGPLYAGGALLLIGSLILFPIGLPLTIVGAVKTKRLQKESTAQLYLSTNTEDIILGLRIRI